MGIARTLTSRLRTPGQAGSTSTYSTGRTAVPGYQPPAPAGPTDDGVVRPGGPNDPTNTANPPINYTPPTGAPDPAQQFRDIFAKRYAWRNDPAYNEQEVNYYLGKLNSQDPDERDRPLEYWLMRARGLGAGDMDRRDYNGEYPEGFGGIFNDMVPPGGFDYDGNPLGAPGGGAPTLPPISGGGGGAPGGGPAGPPASGNQSDIWKWIKEIIEGGGDFNQDLVNNRIETAREGLERRRTGELDNDRAILAERGLLGGGAETSALTRLSEDLNTDFGGDIRDIYSNEMENADERVIQALSLATGMSVEDAKNAVAMAKIQADSALGFAGLDVEREGLDLQRLLGIGRLDLDRTLGLGRLGLDNWSTTADYNLGLGRLGLDRDALGYQMSQGDNNNILALLQALLRGGGV